MVTKKIPLRMCVGCHEMKPKAELVRIVKTPTGELKFDSTGKLNGRGAYICRCKECLDKAQKANALSRAFSMNVDKQIYSCLKEDSDIFGE